MKRMRSRVRVSSTTLPMAGTPPMLLAAHATRRAESLAAVLKQGKQVVEIDDDAP